MRPPSLVRGVIGRKFLVGLLVRQLAQVDAPDQIRGEVAALKGRCLGNLVERAWRGTPVSRSIQHLQGLVSRSLEQACHPSLNFRPSVSLSFEPTEASTRAKGADAPTLADDRKMLKRMPDGF